MESKVDSRTQRDAIEHSEMAHGQSNRRTIRHGGDTDTWTENQGGIRIKIPFPYSTPRPTEPPGNGPSNLSVAPHRVCQPSVRQTCLGTRSSRPRKVSSEQCAGSPRWTPCPVLYSISGRLWFSARSAVPFSANVKYPLRFPVSSQFRMLRRRKRHVRGNDSAPVTVLYYHFSRSMRINECTILVSIPGGGLNITITTRNRLVSTWCHTGGNTSRSITNG